MDNNNLLQPSLDNNSAKIKLYSEHALFFTAFFGTAFAVSIMSAVNSYRLQRLKKDLWLYIVGCVTFAILVYFLLIYAFSSKSEFITSDIRFTVRIASIFIWFIFFSIHKRTHRVNLFVSDGDANPWIVGITCVIIGTAVQIALIKFLLFYISQG